MVAKLPLRPVHAVFEAFAVPLVGGEQTEVDGAGEGSFGKGAATGRAATRAAAGPAHGNATGRFACGAAATHRAARCAWVAARSGSGVATCRSRAAAAGLRARHAKLTAGVARLLAATTDQQGQERTERASRKRASHGLVVS